MDNNITTKQSKKKRILITIGIFLLLSSLCSIGYGLFIIFSDNKESTTTSINTTDTSLSRIKADYQNKKISVNEYFTQLVYLKYDYNKLKAKYKGSKNNYLLDSEIDLTEILDKNYDKLDKNIVKFYLTKETLADVILNSNSKKSNKKMSMTKLANSDVHKLNDVVLSKNGRFLVWYTISGDDAITTEQANEIANSLEDSVSRYSELIGVDYTYTPYVDNKLFNDDYKNGKETLTYNNISVDNLKTAMSVYVYNTGSGSVLASYRDVTNATKVVNRSQAIGLLNEDNIINYPYIVINKQGFSSNDSLKQLYNHELFHHMQYLYCQRETGDRCGSDERIYEGMANFASSVVSNTSTQNNYLNNWASVYKKNISSKLVDITNGSNYGYAIFPYYYMYNKNINNGIDNLMSAHTKSKPFEYLQNKTTTEQLVNTINDLAKTTLNQNFNNNNLNSNEKVQFKKTLKVLNTYNEKIKAGAINYYKLSNKMNISVTTDELNYVNFIIYGKTHDGISNTDIWKEIKKGFGNFEIDLSLYAKYSEIYLIVTNANILKQFEYKINITKPKVVRNSNIITSFKNYTINIDMEMQLNKISSTSKSKGVIDEMHQKEYLETSVTSMGMKVSNIKSYTDYKTGITYMTQPYGGDKWWKEKSTSRTMDLQKIADQLASMKNVTEIDSNHYKVKMNAQDMQGVTNSSNANTANKLDGNIEVDVYLKNGYIEKIQYDFSKLIKSFDKFMVTISFSDYDKSGDINIPESIVNNAIEK